MLEIAQKVTDSVTWVKFKTNEVVAIDKDEHNSVLDELEAIEDKIKRVSIKLKRRERQLVLCKKELKKHNISVPLLSGDDEYIAGLEAKIEELESDKY